MAEEEIKQSAAEVKADTKVADVKADAPETASDAKAKPAKKRGKKGKRQVPSGQVHIKATFNNTIVSVADKSGQVLTASSAGANGFRGSKKGTAYAASVAAEKAIEAAKKDYGLKSADVFVKGIGLGRDSAVRAVASAGLKIDSITDQTPIAHGGVRPKGERKP